eukprot:s136_g18.t3
MFFGSCSSRRPLLLHERNAAVAMGAAIEKCTECEEDQFNMTNTAYLTSVDVANQVTAGEKMSTSDKDPMFQQGPSAPLCDLRGIPAACVPERMSGLTDQECADVRLAQAATRGELKDLQQAIRSGARVDTRAEMHIAMGDAGNAKPGKRTPLMRACASGHLEVVKALLASGASMWRVDSRGWTARMEILDPLLISDGDIARIVGHQQIHNCFTKESAFRARLSLDIMAIIYVQAVGTKYKSSLPVPLEILGDPTVVKVAALKDQVCKHTRISAVKQRMEFKGRVLKDEMTLSDAKLSEGGRIFMEAQCAVGPSWFWH